MKKTFPNLKVYDGNTFMTTLVEAVETIAEEVEDNGWASAIGDYWTAKALANVLDAVTPLSFTTFLNYAAPFTYGEGWDSLEAIQKLKWGAGFTPYTYNAEFLENTPNGGSPGVGFTTSRDFSVIDTGTKTRDFSVIQNDSSIRDFSE